MTFSPASPNHAGEEGPATASAVVNGGAASMPAEGPSPVPFYEQGYRDALLRAIQDAAVTIDGYDRARAVLKQYPGGLDRLAGRVAAQARVQELLRAELEQPVPSQPGQLELLGGGA